MGLLNQNDKRTKEFQRTAVQLQVHALVLQILADPRNQEPARLLRHGFKVYSQAEEDGILQEIFARIGVGPRYFVEFGCEKGLENNSLFLLLQGWRGLWMEGSPKRVAAAQSRFQAKINSGDLKLHHAFINPDNFNQLLEQFDVPAEIDLMSIDIDGNDFHVFSALKRTSPRVVVIEYNAKMRPPLKWVMRFNPQHAWDGSDYFGASLKSLELMANEKGYALVGCNITGSNAFFVRKDLLGDKFSAPYTAENHYEPARYFLVPGMVSGHAPSFGPYDSLPL